MPTDIVSAAGKALFAAWVSLPKRDHVPDHASFDPFSITRFLPVIAITETQSGSDWRLRLSGTEIDRRNGYCLTGRDYLPFIREDVRAMYVGIFASVVGFPCGSWEIRRIELSSGRTSLIEVVRLPLRAPDGRVRFILSSNEEIGASLVPGESARARISTREVDGMTAVISPREHRFFDIGAGVPSIMAAAA